MYSTREEIETWLKEMGIENYVINEDLTVDINGNVDLSFKKLKEVPIKFGTVNGYFNCYNNELTSLKGCPEVINGNFNYFKNKLISLDGCPKEIKDGFNCSQNNLTSLEGCPEVISGNFYFYHNRLTNLEHFPKVINGNGIYIAKNNMKEEELVNFNCEMENVNYIYSDFNEDGDKEEFLEKVRFYKNIKEENELFKEISKNSNNMKLNKKL